jgi:hypothetical protein
VVAACSLVRWLVGSSVVVCCCLVQVCKFEVLQLQLGMLVFAHWFVACCLLLFSSTLQGWGPTPIIGDVFCTLQCSGLAPASGPAVLSFIINE